MIVAGYNFRRMFESFPLEIARGGKLVNSFAFGHFMNKVGTPLETNDLAEATLHDPNSTAPLNYSIVWVLDQIHRAFLEGHHNCELIGVCFNCKIKVDKRCVYEPLDRANDKTDQCPFAPLWKHWKLKGYYPDI